MRVRIKRNKTSHSKAFIWSFLYDGLPLFMIASGVLLSLLQHSEICIIPEPVSKIHLIRTGVIVFLVSASERWEKEALGEEPEKIREDEEEIAEDVPMDE